MHFSEKWTRPYDPLELIAIYKAQTEHLSLILHKKKRTNNHYPSVSLSVLSLSISFSLLLFLASCVLSHMRVAACAFMCVARTRSSRAAGTTRTLDNP